MAFCPTGFSDSGDTRRQCIIDGDIGDVLLSINFPDNDTQWPFLGLNGRFEAPILPLFHPVLLPNRGLYFDGFDDFMRLYDFRFNFQMTIHAWVHIFEDNGFVFSLETATPHPTTILGVPLGDIELGVKFAVEGGIPSIFGRWNDSDSTGAPAAGFLNNWKILNFQLDGPEMKLWGNDELLLDFTFPDAPFFHDTLLNRPHVFGSSVIEDLLNNNNLEMHLFQLRFRNGLIPNPELAFSVDGLGSLDVCKAENLIQ